MDNHSDKAQNVVSMTQYQPEPGYAVISQVEAYWEALRGTRLMPKRSEIDPRGIETALEYAFILERIAPGIARLRVAGSHLTDLMGMEVRGMPLTTFFLSDDRRPVSNLLEEVFQGPGVSTLRLESGGAAGRPPLEARMLLMPLKSDLGDVSRALGCLVCKGDIGEAPRRFGLQEQNLRSLLPPDASLPVDDPTLRAPLPPRPVQATTPGFEAPAAAFEGKPKKPRPPYLRLVKSDKE